MSNNVSATVPNKHKNNRIAHTALKQSNKIQKYNKKATTSESKVMNDVKW